MQQPRAGELIDTVLDNTDVPPYLPRYPGCGTCSEFPSASVGAAVASCGRALAKLGGAHAATAIRYVDCVAGAVKCIQSQPLDPDCSQRELSVCEDVATAFVAKCTEKAARKCKQDAACIAKAESKCTAKADKTAARCRRAATSRCTDAAAKAATCLANAREQCETRGTDLVAARTRSASAIAKACGDESVVPFSTLASRSALYLQALDETCAGVGDPELTDLTDYAACLHDHHECHLADLATSVVPRSLDLATAGILGLALPAAFAGPCAEPEGRTVDASLRIAAPTAEDRAIIFGSILKFVRVIRRPRAGVIGVLRNGPRPASKPGAGRGVRLLGAPTRVTFGALTKIPFRYGRPNRSRAAEDPPVLIVSVQREDVQLTDHFEIALDAIDQGATEVDDELEVLVEERGTLPGCAFTLAFATSIDDEVSDYTTALQVVDPELPTPVPTPVVTPSVTSSPTATATATVNATPVLTPTITQSPVVSPTTTQTPTTTPTTAVTATLTRTPTPSPTSTTRLVDNGDGTVTDTQLGLQWERKTGTVGNGVDCSSSACPDPHHVNNRYQWCLNADHDADCDNPDIRNGGAFIDFLDKLNHRCRDDQTFPCIADGDCSAVGGPGGPCGFAGHTNWRLPTSEGRLPNLPSSEFGELESILRPCDQTGCIDQIVFGPTVEDVYWSNTDAGANGSERAWFVSFSDGISRNNFKYNDHYVRAVRTGP